MPQTCSICKHKKRNQIEAAVTKGEALRRIATQFETSEAAIRRHKSCIVEVLEKADVKKELATIATVREVLESLTDDMRADLTNLFTDDGAFDLAHIKRQGLGKMLKSLTFKRDEVSNKNEIPVETVRVETYSRQEAAKSLLNAYTKLEIAKLMNEGLLLSERERTDRAMAIFNAARDRRVKEIGVPSTTRSGS